MHRKHRYISTQLIVVTTPELPPPPSRSPIKPITCKWRAPTPSPRQEAEHRATKGGRALPPSSVIATATIVTVRSAALSQELIQAKLEAAQFSLDRDEAKKKLREARDQTYEVQQQLNDLEEKHAELQRAYETDMNQFIEVKLKCAEAVSRVMQLEEELDSLQ
uniref:Uncharacterized protein n=1 Tax=Chrysotila carterae TaxID=13221 RepID=A0A7S4BX98_CHRCT